MATAIVRLKRRLDEDPHEGLVLACKRKKSDDLVVTENKIPFTAVFKFAGTVKNQVNRYILCTYVLITQSEIM
jgi:hypothetical protein